MKRSRIVPNLVKPLVFAAALAPFAGLSWGALHATLGPNPVETLTHTTGDWALRFLLLTLSVTPLRAITGWVSLIRFRRMLGLFSFFYASLHLLTYVGFDQSFSVVSIARDIPKRPFVTAGLTAFLLLVPLALTSTAGMIRRLGGKRWRALHRLVYVAAATGVVHYWWLVKADTTLPAAYAVALGVLFTARALVAWRRAASARARASFVPQST